MKSFWLSQPNCTIGTVAGLEEALIWMMPPARCPLAHTSWTQHSRVQLPVCHPDGTAAPQSTVAAVQVVPLLSPVMALSPNLGGAPITVDAARVANSYTPLSSK